MLWAWSALGTHVNLANRLGMMRTVFISVARRVHLPHLGHTTRPAITAFHLTTRLMRENPAVLIRRF